MTGTAITEAPEFMKIYELQVVEIPTNEPMVRADKNDQIYKTKEGKWNAVLAEIEGRHAKEQPVLVGTISVEVSELLSERLKQRGIPHTVLNAKPEHAAREAEIVAEAGQPGGVTIATNMAGRGVDIKLGGNAEHLTHQALLGRGLDPDGDEWKKAWDEGYPGIQKKVEEQNFLIRKRVLEYDDVMNQQREVVYEYRDRILEGEDMSETARLQVADSVERLVDDYLVGDYAEDWDIEGLFTQLEQVYPVAIAPADANPQTLAKASLVADLREDVVKAYEEREEELGPELMRYLERWILLQIIDDRWREHLHDMDYLREGIHLRGFAQIDPLVAYKNEGFGMFTALIHSIWEEFARYILRG